MEHHKRLPMGRTVGFFSRCAAAVGLLIAFMHSHSALADASIALPYEVLPYRSVQFPVINYTGATPPAYVDKQMTITNDGTELLYGMVLTMSHAQFTVVGHNCPGNFYPGQSCGVTLRFTASGVGAMYGTLDVYFNGLPFVYPVNLYGQANVAPGNLTVSAGTLSYGPQSFGTQTVQTITLGNNGGQPLTLTNLYSTTADYIVAPPGTDSGQCAPNTVLGVGQSCQFAVGFVPTSTGTLNSQIGVTHTGTNGIAGVNLMGTGAGLPGNLFGGVATEDINVSKLPQATVAVTTSDDCPPDRTPGTQCTGRVIVTPPPPGPAYIPPWSRCGSSESATDPLCTGRICHGNCSRTQEEEDELWLHNLMVTQLDPEGCGKEDLPVDSTPTVGDASDIHHPSLLQEPFMVASRLNDLGANVRVDNATYTADPIHGAIGNKSHTQIDYSSQGAFRLGFSRTYHSLAPYSSSYVRQKLGPGWYGMWDKSVATEQNGNAARVTRGDGTSIVFTLSNGVWTPPALVFAQLTRLVNASGVHTGWSYSQGTTVEAYDVGGYLQSVSLGSGQLYTLTYGQGGTRLERVTDPLGRQLQFSYDVQNRLYRLTDPGGGVTEYSYDTPYGRLVSVKYPDNRIRKYKYEHPTFKFALTSIVTSVGAEEKTYVTFTYHADGRAAGNVFAGGSGSATVAYNATGSVTNDPTGAVVTRAFEVKQGRILPSSVQYDLGCSGQACTVPPDTFTHNEDGTIATRTSRGITTSYTYTTDGRKLIASLTEAPGTSVARTVTTTWHPTLSKPIQVIEATRTTNYTYDGAGRVLSVSVVANGETRTTTHTYNPQGFLLSIDGPRTDVSDITTFTYHASGNIHTVTNPKGQVTTFHSYDAHGHPTSITRPDGTTATYTYDARGRLGAKTEAGQTTTNTYDNHSGLLTSTTDPSGAVTTYVYDPAHRLIRKQYSNGERVEYSHSNAGNIVQTRTYDAQGILSAQSSKTYDNLGRVTASTDANGKTTTFAYDTRGNLKTVTDANGLITAREYDALNRPIIVTAPLTAAQYGGISFPLSSATPAVKSITTYTNNDDIASVRDPIQNLTSYSYNGFGDNTGIQSPDSGSTAISYNKAGQAITSTDARGKTTTRVVDSLGRDISISFTDSTGVTLSYDSAGGGVGKLASAVDASGSTTFAYDSYGRVVGKYVFFNGAFSKHLIYTRDSIGRISAVTYPSGNVVGASFTENRVTTITLNGIQLISGIEHFPGGGPESWLLGPYTTGTRAYIRYADLNGRIERYLTPAGYRRFTFDNVGRISSVGDFLGSSTTPTASQTIVYDTLGRLTQFNGFTSNGSAQARVNQTQSFTYDDNGNRLSSVLNGTTANYSYHAGSNRLAGITGGISRANQFDLAGNIIADGVVSYSYEGSGRMTAATAGGQTTAYVVNYQGLRTKKSNAGGARYFLYDDSGKMLGEYDAAGNTVLELIWLGDTLVAVYGKMPCLTGAVGCVENATAYVWTDHLGTPRHLTRVNGSGQHVPIWEWDSLPFGETSPNDNPSGLGVMTFNHRFPGQYWDAETGKHQNWRREYDPLSGRYLQSDPIGLAGGLNTYAYVGGNPFSNTDATGLVPNQNCLNACVRGGMLLGQLLGRGVGTAGGAIGGGLVGTVIGGPGAGTAVGGTVGGVGGGILGGRGGVFLGGVVGGIVGSAACSEETESRCDELNRIDTDTCNAITRRRGADAGAKCHASASARYAACRRGEELPPLNTWNN